MPTITTTVTKLVPPPVNSELFWIFPLLFMLLPAFGFAAAFYSYDVKKNRNITPNYNLTVFMFILGMNAGVIFGIFALITPWPMLILTMGLLIMDVWRGGVV